MYGKLKAKAAKEEAERLRLEELEKLRVKEQERLKIEKEEAERLRLEQEEKLRLKAKGLSDKEVEEELAKEKDEAEEAAAKVEAEGLRGKEEERLRVKAGGVKLEEAQEAAARKKNGGDPASSAESLAKAQAKEAAVKKENLVKQAAIEQQQKRSDSANSTNTAAAANGAAANAAAANKKNAGAKGMFPAQANNLSKLPGRALQHPTRTNLRVLTALGLNPPQNTLTNQPRRLNASPWEDLLALGSNSRVLGLLPSKISTKKIQLDNFRRRARSALGDSKEIKFQIFDSNSLGSDLNQKFSFVDNLDFDRKLGGNGFIDIEVSQDWVMRN